MRVLIAVALAASGYAAAPAGTSHDDPIAGEHGSVRLFFLKRTLLDRTVVPGIPSDQVWQHTHQGPTFVVVDPGNGSVKTVPIGDSSSIKIQLGQGPGYTQGAGSITIRAMNKPDTGPFVEQHLVAFENIRTERCGPDGERGRKAAAVMTQLHGELAAPGGRLSRSWLKRRLFRAKFDKWRGSICPAARAEIEAQMRDMNWTWVTALSTGSFGAPADAGGKVVHTLATGPKIRMKMITVTSGSNQQEIAIDGAECARFVICSHEEVRDNKGQACALPPHSVSLLPGTDRPRACAAR